MRMMYYLQKIEELMTQTFLFEECGLFRPWSFRARPLTRPQLHLHALQTRRAGPSNAAAQVGKATRLVGRLCFTEAGLPHAVTAITSRMHTGTASWAKSHTRQRSRINTQRRVLAAARVYPMMRNKNVTQ